MEKKPLIISAEIILRKDMTEVFETITHGFNTFKGTSHYIRISKEGIEIFVQEKEQDITLIFDRQY